MLSILILWTSCSTNQNYSELTNIKIEVTGTDGDRSEFCSDFKMTKDKVVLFFQNSDVGIHLNPAANCIVLACSSAADNYVRTDPIDKQARLIGIRLEIVYRQ